MARAEIETRIAAIDAMLRPAPDLVAAVWLYRALGPYKLPRDWRSGGADAYLTAMEQVPAALLGVTLERVRLSLTFTPSPAEILACVPDAAAQRRIDRMRLGSMLRRLERDEADQARRVADRRAS